MKDLHDDILDAESTGRVRRMARALRISAAEVIRQPLDRFESRYETREASTNPFERFEFFGLVGSMLMLQVQSASSVHRDGWARARDPANSATPYIKCDVLSRSS